MMSKHTSKCNQFAFSLLVAIIVTMIGSVSTQTIIAANPGKLPKRRATASRIRPKQSSTTTSNGRVNSEVFSMGAYGDTELGFITDLKAASYLDAAQRNALALEIAGGPNVIRVNTTYGLGLTDKHRIKLTYEFLGENLDFSFDSGTVSRWVYQNAVGGDYAYLIDNAYIESVGFGGYYSYSGSKNLSDKIADNVYTEQRRIAGANSGNVHVNVALHLWSHSRLSGGMDYDIVRFNSKYDAHDDDVDGVGGHVRLEQRLLPRLKATFGTQLQHTQRQYRGSIGWLMPSPAGMQLELMAITDYVDSLATHRRFYSNGGRLNVSLNPGTGTYNDLEHGQHQSLLNWIRDPAVRMTAVLAVVDKQLSTVRCLLPSELQALGGGEYGGEGWLGSAVGFDLDNASFIDAQFDALGEARCEYYDNMVTLAVTRGDTTGVVGPPAWGPGGMGEICTASEAACLFTL